MWRAFLGVDDQQMKIGDSYFDSKLILNNSLVIYIKKKKYVTPSNNHLSGEIIFRRSISYSLRITLDNFESRELDVNESCLL